MTRKLPSKPIPPPLHKSNTPKSKSRIPSPPMAPPTKKAERAKATTTLSGEHKDIAVDEWLKSPSGLR